MQIRSINPATEEVLAEFETMSLEAALKCARSTGMVQKMWSSQSVKARCVYMEKLAHVLRGKILEYATLMTKEMGKPITQSKAEVEKCALMCEFYAAQAPAFLAPDHIPTEAKKSYVRFDPLGVVLGVMPWNFPFWQVFRFVVPALAAGNGALLKHASNVPQCALAIEGVFIEAGFPEGIFKTLLIDANVAMQLIASNAVDAVSLTGSTQAGASVAEVAGRNLKKCVLELGGSDAFIVLKDADLEAGAKTAVQARMVNAGQSCIAAKRFIIEAAVAPEFQRLAAEHFSTLKMGDPTDESVTIGPLAKADIRDSLRAQLERAVLEGAQIVKGGTVISGKGYFFEPTLLTNVTPQMAVATEETFGPLMPLIVARDRAEALRIANDSAFGLGASVWTRDLSVAEEMAAELETGFVAINAMVKSDQRLPFGGVKKSGFGRELGSYGIREFVNIKTVVVH